LLLSCNKEYLVNSCTIFIFIQIDGSGIRSSLLTQKLYSNSLAFSELFKKAKDEFVGHSLYYYLLFDVFCVIFVNRSSVAGASSVLRTFPTESVSVLTLHFSEYNYLIAAGSGS